MKIVHVEDCFDPTAGYQVNELAVVAAKSGDEVWVVTSSDMSPFHKSLSQSEDSAFEDRSGVRIVRLPSRLTLSGRRLLGGLRAALADIRPDLVFLHGIGDFKDLSLLGRKPSYLIVRDCHMSWAASRNPLRGVFMFLFRHSFAKIINNSSRYACVYALGDEEREYLLELGVSPAKIRFLRHGYDRSMMFYDESSRVSARQSFGLSQDATVLAYIGKFDFFKRPDLILDIVSRIDRELLQERQVQLLFIGPKAIEYRDFFNMKLSGWGVDCLVTVGDAQPFVRLPQVFSAVDICIFPREASLSSIHAQVCGCEVVMEDQTANRERVVNKQNLFPCGDLDEATNRVVRILRDQELSDRDRNLPALSARDYQNQVAELRSLVTAGAHT